MVPKSPRGHNPPDSSASKQRRRFCFHSVRLFVSRITQKLLDRFSRN